MREIKICLWCGKDHADIPNACLVAGRKASEILKTVETWLLFAVVRNYGLKALDDFEFYAEQFVKNFKRR